MALLVSTSNVKLSVDVSGCERALERVRSLFRARSSPHGNFFVLRRDFTYVVFLGGHVNVTGVRSLSQLPRVRRELGRILALQGGEERGLPSFRVDNICSRGQSPFGFVPLAALLAAFAAHLRDAACPFAPFVRRLAYRPEKFPALQVRTGVGTLLLFGSGKFVFVGYRRPLDAHCLLRLLWHALGLESDHCHVECRGLRRLASGP